MNVGSLNLLIPLWYLWKILIDEMQNYLHIKLKILTTASSTSIWLLRTPQTHEDLFTISPCYPMCIVIAKITCYGSNLRSMTGEVVSLQMATFRMLVLLTMILLILCNPKLILLRLLCKCGKWNLQHFLQVFILKKGGEEPNFLFLISGAFFFP